MDLQLRGKVAVVVGASGGIGSAIVRSLLDEGANVLAVGRDRDRLSALKVSERSSSNELATFEVDLLKEESGASRMAAEATRRFAAIHILVNVAADNAHVPRDGTASDAVKSALGAKLALYTATMDACLPVLTHGGVVINVAGLAGVEPIPGFAGGSAANAAVLAVTKALAGQYAARHIRLLALSPGLVDTERFAAIRDARAKKDGVTPDEAARRLVEHIPLRRAAAPDEIAAIVTFLASERCAYLTGVNVLVDGGSSHAI